MLTGKPKAQRGRRSVDAIGKRSGEQGPDREARVSAFFQDYRGGGRGPVRHALRNPRATVAVVRDMLLLPRLTAALSSSDDGRTIRAAILDKHPVRRVFPHASVLVLPSVAARYSEGHAKQTLRRKIRKAEQRHITWKRVDDPVERQKLVQLADDWERINPQKQYRNPNPENDELPVHPLWLVAYSDDGRPLLLSVTPVDGEWALLRYFKSIGAGEEQSLARYYMMQVLVDHIVPMGVRYLFDVTSPLRLPNGLRHYQRMIGFRIFRIRVTRRR